MSESQEKTLSFPKAEEQRNKRDANVTAKAKIDQCSVQVAEHLNNGEWRYKPFRWEGPLSSAALANLEENGWKWKQAIWFEQVGPSYSEQVTGYKFE